MGETLGDKYVQERVGRKGGREEGGSGLQMGRRDKGLGLQIRVSFRKRNAKSGPEEKF